MIPTEVAKMIEAMTDKGIDENIAHDLACRFYRDLRKEWGLED